MVIAIYFLLLREYLPAGLVLMMGISNGLSGGFQLHGMRRGWIVSSAPDGDGPETPSPGSHAMQRKGQQR